MNSEIIHFKIGNKFKFINTFYKSRLNRNVERLVLYQDLTRLRKLIYMELKIKDMLVIYKQSEVKHLRETPIILHWVVTCLCLCIRKEKWVLNFSLILEYLVKSDLGVRKKTIYKYNSKKKRMGRIPI